MVTSCQKSETTPDKMPKLQMKEKVVQVKMDDKLGKILTDASGRTLYVFTLDADGKNHCSGDCEKIWPIFFADNVTSETIGMGLDIKDFRSIQLISGKKQTTYKEHPLSMEARGYQGGEGRTKYRVLSWELRDTLAIFIIILLGIVLFFFKDHNI